MFGGQDAGAEDENFRSFRKCFQGGVAVEGVEVVQEGLQVRVAAGVVEDGDGGGVFGLGGDDVPDVQVLGRFGLGGPEEELVGGGRALLARDDPAYGAGGLSRNSSCSI